MKLNRAVREFRRRCGISLLNEGVSPAVTAKALSVTRETLRQWQKLASLPHGLELKPVGGRPRKLTQEQLTKLEELLLQGPCVHGWPNELWTTKRIAEMIRRHFRVNCSPGQAWTTVTKYLGWTSQRPAQQLREPDDEEIEQWLANDYPRIMERARRRNAHLVFVDESGFMLAPTIRRTYSPRGSTPVCTVTNPHSKIAVIGAMTISPERRHFGFHFQLSEDNLNFRGSAVAHFIAEVQRKVPHPIVLLWDGMPIHRANPVLEYLNRHRTIVVEMFPPHAPDLNPVDKIWFYVKFDRLPNFTPPDLADLRVHITEEFRRLQKRPDVLESLFHLTKLTLDAHCDHPYGAIRP
jgi:transposase